MQKNEQCHFFESKILVEVMQSSIAVNMRVEEVDMEAANTYASVSLSQELQHISLKIFSTIM